MKVLTPALCQLIGQVSPLNAYYLPEALNPRVHKPVISDRVQLEKEIGIDVTMFGTMYPYRARMASEVINAGINVALFGIPDKRFPREEITKNFRKLIY